MFLLRWELIFNNYVAEAWIKFAWFSDLGSLAINYDLLISLRSYKYLTL